MSKKKAKTRSSPSSPALAITLPRAMALMESGHLTQAESVCRILLEKNPEDADAIHVLGLALARKGDATAAIAELERALALRPSYPACRQSLGQLLMESAPERAEECFRRVIEEVPNAVVSYRNLATLLERRGELKAAEQALRGLLRYAALDEDALRGLAALQRQLGEHEAEVETGHLLMRLRPNDPRLRAAVSNAYFFLFETIYRTDLTKNRDKALRVLREWLALDPAHPVAQHMHSALTGEMTPKRASDAYVTKHFDEFASQFDETLAELGYDAPARMKDALARLVPIAAANLTIADLGCGTGALGPLIAPWKKTLIGVDLSPAMIERANARGVYDELHVAELINFVGTQSDRLDVAMCLDTLIYIGDIDELFRATHDALHNGGHFLATAEELAPETGKSFTLHEGGRYAHAEEYLREQLAKHGFQLVELSRHALRKERGQDVPGLFFAARRKD